MVFTKYVEIGRVAYVAFGPDQGKLVAIVDVLDQTRALIDGPCTGVGRKMMPFKQMHLTKFVIRIGPSSRSGVVKKAWEKAEIDQKFAETTWAKKLESREKRALLTDYDRFKLMKARQARNSIINVQFGKLRKAGKKNPKAKRVNKKSHK